MFEKKKQFDNLGSVSSLIANVRTRSSMEDGIVSLLTEWWPGKSEKNIRTNLKVRKGKTQTLLALEAKGPQQVQVKDASRAPPQLFINGILK